MSEPPAYPFPPPPAAAPLPWDYELHPNGFVYLLDAEGRRFASILGPREEKPLTAELIIATINVAHGHPHTPRPPGAHRVTPLPKAKVQPGAIFSNLWDDEPT